MKNLSEYLVERVGGIHVTESEKTITDEKSFREAAEAKFKEVFKDELDEEQMNETIDGLLKDNADLVEAGKWGELIGMLNKSFGK